MKIWNIGGFTWLFIIVIFFVSGKTENKKKNKQEKN